MNESRRIRTSPRRRCPSVRVLCLGNDLLTDDAFGFVVAQRLRRRLLPSVDVVCTGESGIGLLDYLTGPKTVIVIDTVEERSHPGRIHVFDLSLMEAPAGNSPHSLGLVETLHLLQELRLAAPRQVITILVEAADCTTIGGTMDSRVFGAVPRVTQIALQKIRAAVRITRTPDGRSAV